MDETKPSVSPNGSKIFNESEELTKSIGRDQLRARSIDRPALSKAVHPTARDRDRSNCGHLIAIKNRDILKLT